MKVITQGRKVVNLTNEPPKMAKVEYESIVFGDYHFLDYDDNSSNAEGDVILDKSDGVRLTPIGDNLYLSANGDVYEYVDGDIDDFYGANKGKSKGSTSKESKSGGKSGGFFKKVGSAFGKGGKWIGKQAKKFVKFIGKLKPKKGARKLKPRKIKGQTKNVDVIPVVVPTTMPSGEKVMAKQNEDGTQTVVPKTDVVTAPNGQQVDKKDLEGAGETMVSTNPETGEKEVVKVVEDSQVTTLQTAEGENIPFKTEDLVEKTQEELKKEGEEPKGMSKGLKIGLIIGGSVLFLGLIGFLIYRAKNKGK
jgi:hypothetical protein